MQRIIRTILIGLVVLFFSGCKGEFYLCEYVIHDTSHEVMIVNAVKQIATSQGFHLTRDDDRGVIFIKHKDDDATNEFKQLDGSSGVSYSLAYGKKRNSIVLIQDYKNIASQYCLSLEHAIELMLDETVGKSGYSRKDTTVNKPFML
jgi:hypothetical protein